MQKASEFECKSRQGLICQRPYLIKLIKCFLGAAGHVTRQKGKMKSSIGRRKRGQPKQMIMIAAVVALTSWFLLIFSYTSKTKTGGKRSFRATEVFAVGTCSKFMTHIHNCSHTGSDRYHDIINAIDKEASFVGKKNLRELRCENGKSIAPNDPIPSKVYALFDREQFMLPTCRIGTQYRIELPSAQMEVNATGFLRFAPARQHLSLLCAFSNEHKSSSTGCG
jgi:hypothetical protein